MMCAGLYPIVSRDTGITLPSGRGIYLESCTSEEVAHACITVSDMSPRERIESIEECQHLALHEYSREAFSQDMLSYLECSLDRHMDGGMKSYTQRTTGVTDRREE